MSVGAGAGAAAVGVASQGVVTPSAAAAANAAPRAISPHPVLSDNPVEAAPGGSFGTIAACPAGEVATGGGGKASQPYAIRVSDSYLGEPNAWVWNGTNIGNQTVKVWAQVMCSRP